MLRVVEIAKLDIPEGLGEYGSRLWIRLTQEFKITDAAGLALAEQAARCTDRIEEARAIIARDGILSLDRYGSPKAHPLLDVEKCTRTSLVNVLRALNLETLVTHSGPGRPPGRGV